MEAEKDQLYYSGNEFHKVRMTGLVGLTRDGVLGWERPEVVPYCPGREIMSTLICEIHAENLIQP